jgi:hypothetical protein
MDYATLGMGRRADSLEMLVDLLAQGVHQRRAPLPPCAGRAAALVASHIVALAAQRDPT